mmetsp:Transcript_544/g.1277  ORF Transcript_544/g.1277 Transcript_544/m.1277 type:complete len:103 (+) Transcript_544:366-674(+)
MLSQLPPKRYLLRRRKWTITLKTLKIPFFQALLHNNDADSGVVNVKSASKQRVDEELFSKLDEKIFRRHRGEVSEEERKEEVDGKKVTYGLREFLEDSTLIE